MVARVVIGKRGTEYGMWVSPPGIDALTAAASQMVIQMTNAIDQIIMTGTVSSNQTVALGLLQKPLVLLVSKGFRSGFGDCATSPSPLGSDLRRCSVVVSEASMAITAPQQCMYAVLRRAF